MDCRLIFVVLVFGFMNHALSEVDIQRYNEGKHQYQLLQYKSEMPQYGQCWVDAMAMMQAGCKQLSDDTQARLALAYLNCFMKLQGLEDYPCPSDTDIHHCTKSLRDSDRSSFTTFFTHTQSICYFLQAQIWHEETELTISRLADKSHEVVSQLAASHRLQEDMLNSQSQSLHNQEELMGGARTLRGIINSSSDNVRALFEDLKTSTKEQRQIMGDVFDQLLNLRSTILGEVSGFYSLFFYVLSLLVCYILTSAPRTLGARVWLFVVMTVNVVLEQTVVKWIAGQNGNDEDLYWLQKLCRQFFILIGLVVLCFCAYMYQDINEKNNELLGKIARQNSDIKKKISSCSLNPLAAAPDTPTTFSKDESSDSDYTSNDDEDLDLTFVPDETSRLPDDGDTESCDSSVSAESEATSSSMVSELSFLRESTPIREFGWLSQQSHIGGSNDDSPFGHSYNLRKRSTHQLSNQSKISPALKVESPNSFSRTVRHLQQVSEKNSRLLRARIGQGASLIQSNVNLSAAPTFSSPSPTLSPATRPNQGHMTPAGDLMVVSSSKQSPHNIFTGRY